MRILISDSVYDKGNDQSPFISIGCHRKLLS